MISSLDVLYLVIAFAVLWITLFICWFIYQAALMLRAVNQVMQEVTKTLERVEHALNGIKGRFEKGGEHLGEMASHMKDAASRMASDVKQKMKK